MVTQFELDVIRGDMNDVRILDGCKADKVIHSFILDCERRIFVEIVLAMYGVIKVVAEQSSTFICHNLIVVNQDFNLLC